MAVGRGRVGVAERLLRWAFGADSPHVAFVLADLRDERASIARSRSRLSGGAWYAWELIRVGTRVGFERRPNRSAAQSS